MKNDDLRFLDGLIEKQCLGRTEVVPMFSKAAPQYTMFTVDRSTSMEWTDFAPDRYRAAVKACDLFVQIRSEVSPQDIVGAVLFNTGSYEITKRCSITEADSKVILPLRAVTPGGGTRIESGLKRAGKILAKAPDGFGLRIILLSDGHGGRPFACADDLKSKGIMIDTIGIGGSHDEVDEVGLKGIASISDETGAPRYRFIGDGNIEELFSHFRKLAADIVRV
jgi:Mg-chelatase subunit ChlD